MPAHSSTVLVQLICYLLALITCAKIFSLVGEFPGRAATKHARSTDGHVPPPQGHGSASVRAARAPLPAKPLQQLLSEQPRRPQRSRLFPIDVTASDSRFPRFVRRSDDARTRRNALVAIGIPSISRNGSSYLFFTLGAMIDRLSVDERRLCVFVVYLADSNATSVALQADELAGQFEDEIESGMLEIIGLPNELLSGWQNHLIYNYGDAAPRVKWRSKQNLDEHFLLSYIIRRIDPQFYLMMEDDVMTEKTYLTQILTRALSQPSAEWEYMSFASTVGGAGKLFHYASTRQFCEFVALFWNTKPLDWLLYDFVVAKHCDVLDDTKSCKAKVNSRVVAHQKDLFHHKGVVSSKTSPDFWT